MTTPQAIAFFIGSLGGAATGLGVGYLIGPSVVRWDAERRTHKRLLREHQEKLERELIEAHIAEHQKLWERDHP